MTAVLRCLAGMGATLLRVFAGQLVWEIDRRFRHDRCCHVCDTP